MRDGALAERLRSALSTASELRIVDPEEELEPSVLITDMPVAEEAQDTPMVALVDAAAGLAALRAGAAAVLSPYSERETLRAAIGAAAAGLTVLGAELRELIGAEAGAGGQDMEAVTSGIELTRREFQVLRCLVQGASNKVIARQLDITSHTVKFHVASIIGKLGASGRTDAVAKAMSLGLVMI